MIIKASRNLGWNSDPVEYTFDITGAGLIEDPYVIVYKNYYFDYNSVISLFNSFSFTKIKNITLKFLYIKNCENLIISDISVKYLGIENCSKIKVEIAKITKKLKISNCHEIQFADCAINKLFAYSGDQLFFADCIIQKTSRKSNATISMQTINKDIQSNVNSHLFDQPIKPDFLTCKQCDSEIDMLSIFCHECGFRIK